MQKRKKKFVIVFAAMIAVITMAYFFGINHSAIAAQSFMPPIGTKAPNYSFIYASNGTMANVTSLEGKPVLLWFVTTWCSGCAVGNEMLNDNISYFRNKGINVIEIELYRDLGYSGPSINAFVDSYAPNATSYGNFRSAISEYNMTLAYDKDGYLDIYYLVSPSGKILYENNGGLAATLIELKDKVAALSGSL
ncbi:MAG: redoxin domain-containing protein [Candidatus Parvarchaeum sp.]